VATTTGSLLAAAEAERETVKAPSQRLLVPWLVLWALCSWAMWSSPGEEVVPYHLIWIGFALAYGFEAWPAPRTTVALVLATVVTGAILVAGLVLLAVAMGWIALTLSATLPYSQMWPPFLLAGIGMGLVFAPSSTAVLANMRPADHAKASGTNSTLREVGVALGVAVLTAVFTGAGGELTPTGYVDAAVPAIAVGGAVLLATAIVSLFLPHGRALRTASIPTVPARETVDA